MSVDRATALLATARASRRAHAPAFGAGLDDAGFDDARLDDARAEETHRGQWAGPPPDTLIASTPRPVVSHGVQTPAAPSEEGAGVGVGEQPGGRGVPSHLERARGAHTAPAPRPGGVYGPLGGGGGVVGRPAVPGGAGRADTGAWVGGGNGERELQTRLRPSPPAGDGPTPSVGDADLGPVTEPLDVLGLGAGGDAPATRRERREWESRRGHPPSRARRNRRGGADPGLDPSAPLPELPSERLVRGRDGVWEIPTGLAGARVAPPWLAVGGAALVVMLAVAAGGWAVSDALSNGYFVTTADGAIVIDQGLDQEVFGKKLHHRYQATCLDRTGRVSLIDAAAADGNSSLLPTGCTLFTLNDLPEADRDAVAKLSGGNYDTAVTHIQRLAGQALPVCVTRTPAGDSDATTTARPTPAYTTTPPTTSPAPEPETPQAPPAPGGAATAGEPVPSGSAPAGDVPPADGATGVSASGTTTPPTTTTTTGPSGAPDRQTSGSRTHPGIDCREVD